MAYEKVRNLKNLSDEIQYFLNATLYQSYVQ